MDRRFDGGGGGGDCGGGGPTGSNSGGANEVVGHMYYDNVSSSRLGTENFSTNSQPFHIFATPYSTTTFKSPGYIPNSLSLSLQLYWGYETGINVGKRNVAAFLTGSQSVCENYAERIMAASVAFPFTSAQWRELEQQAMIYKYMISSVPVPPDLLLPLSRNFVDSSVPSMYNVRYLKNEDPEPGRCKRTDGKKWRCSKNVAPNQKYCERHLHRGRPRSRKPVEVKSNGENKKTRFEQRNISSHSTELLDPKSDLHFANAPSKANRDLSLMMEANTGFANEGSSIYSPTSLFYQDYVEENPLNMLSYSSFAATEIDAPNGLVDAWSIGNGPSLDLSIAMASESYLDQEMANTKSYDEQSIKDFLGPVSWETFGQGGPLAEALPAFGCENRASPHDSIGPAATSPIGVLHRTLFSHSDGSVCNFSLCNFS